MQGTVKWFSEQKGYGFVAPDDGRDDHFLHIKNVGGHVTPATGARVTFESESGPRGLVAASVVVDSGGKAAEHSKASGDQRVVCSNCQRRMVPRIITGPPRWTHNRPWTPIPKYSICPFCAHTHEHFTNTSGQGDGLVAVVAIIIFVLGAFIVGPQL